MDEKLCDNCGSKIGIIEEEFQFQGKVLCKECRCQYTNCHSDDIEQEKNNIVADKIKPADKETTSPLTKNGIATASLVFGIFAIAYHSGLYGLVSGVIAIILGILARIRIHNNNSLDGNVKSGWAIGLGIISIVLFGLFSYINFAVFKNVSELVSTKPELFDSNPQNISPIESPITLVRNNFELKYPNTWIIDTEEEVYDSERCNLISSKEDNSIRIVIFEKPLDVQQYIKTLKEGVIDDLKISEISTSSLKIWGNYQGEGLEIRGKIFGLLKGNIKLFCHSTTDKAFVALMITFDETFVKDKEGFDLIESTFRFKNNSEE